MYLTKLVFIEDYVKRHSSRIKNMALKVCCIDGAA